MLLMMSAMMIITVWRALWCVHGSQYQAITREAAYIFIRHNKTMIRWQESLYYGYWTQVRSLSTLVTHRLTHWMTLVVETWPMQCDSGFWGWLLDASQFLVLQGQLLQWWLKFGQDFQAEFSRHFEAYISTFAHIFSQSVECIRILYRPN